jgi:two-component system phosphate regulon response regulator OmpR
MASLPETPTPQVGILILDDDTQSSGAVRQILDAEGWRVRVVSDARMLFAELRTGEWSLVIANIALAGLDTPLFVTLRELTTVPHEEGGRVRSLFLVPELSGGQYVRGLEQARLPYVIRPYHLHDFLEKISDLLVEVKVIDAPIRLVRHEFGNLRKKRKEARTNSMFAARDSYCYTEEELAEYERLEAEISRNKRSKLRKDDLGNPRI